MRTYNNQELFVMSLMQYRRTRFNLDTDVAQEITW